MPSPTARPSASVTLRLPFPPHTHPSLPSDLSLFTPAPLAIPPPPRQADFIVAGRLAAKVDRVAGVVQTARPDANNALYQAAIKQGDALLNRVQKLSKVVDIE